MYFQYSLFSAVLKYVSGIASKVNESAGNINHIGLNIM